MVFVCAPTMSLNRLIVALSAPVSVACRNIAVPVKVTSVRSAACIPFCLDLASMKTCFASPSGNLDS